MVTFKVYFNIKLQKLHLNSVEVLKLDLVLLLKF